MNDTNELISRQAAIDRINKQREHLQPDIYPPDKIGDAAYRICAEFIERLPSAQPEIIRCRDCKHRYLDGMIWNCPFGLSGGEDFFCAYGARMEAEE